MVPVFSCEVDRTESKQLFWQRSRVALGRVTAEPLSPSIRLGKLAAIAEAPRAATGHQLPPGAGRVRRRPCPNSSEERHGGLAAILCVDEALLDSLTVQPEWPHLSTENEAAADRTLSVYMETDRLRSASVSDSSSCEADGGPSPRIADGAVQIMIDNREQDYSW